MSFRPRERIDDDTWEIGWHTKHLVRSRIEHHPHTRRVARITIMPSLSTAAIVLMDLILSTVIVVYIFYPRVQRDLPLPDELDAFGACFGGLVHLTCFAAFFAQFKVSSVCCCGYDRHRCPKWQRYRTSSLVVSVSESSPQDDPEFCNVRAFYHGLHAYLWRA